MSLPRICYKSKGYKCLFPPGKLYISRNVVFDETEFPYNHLFCPNLPTIKQLPPQFPPFIPVLPKSPLHLPPSFLPPASPRPIPTNSPIIPHSVGVVQSTSPPTHHPHSIPTTSTDHALAISPK